MHGYYRFDSVQTFVLARISAVLVGNEVFKLLFLHPLVGVMASTLFCGYLFVATAVNWSLFLRN